MKDKSLLLLLCLATGFAFPATAVYACICTEPVASFTASPNPVCVGSPVSFDATDSYDPDCEFCDSCGGVDLVNGISKFEWDWTNDGTYDESESPESAGDEDAAKASHIYSSAGVYTCKLRVTDNDDGCCCSDCDDQTNTTTVTITVVEVTKVEAGGKETGETLYLANDYLDEPDKRGEKQQTVVATLNPSVSPPDNFCWTPDCGESLPKICPDDALSATFTAKDHDKYTVTAACCNSSKSMYIAIEGVNIKTANIAEADEMTKTYNIFLNEDFDQQLPAADEPGHADCLLPDNDNSDDTLTGDDMSEIGEINFTAETHEDPGATVYFTSSSIIKLYDSEKNKLDFGYNNKYDPNDLGSTLYVEGIAEGTTTLTATLTTGDEFTATDSILIKVIGLDFKAVNRLPSAENPHEICYRDKLIILVNDNDTNANGEGDLNDSTISGGDPDLAMISLFKPNATEEDVPGNITVTFPGGVNVYRKSDKSIGPISSFSEPLSYFTDPNNPTYMHARVDFFLEGKTASSAILDQHVKVEMTLDSGVKCDDEIRYTVIDINLDMEGLEDKKETMPGGFIALNDDDDDDNHTADKDESGAITNEDNLVQITAQKVLPIVLTGNVTLKASAGGTKIKVWSNATKGGTPVTLPQTYATPADLPKILYVEGYEASSGVRDITLALEYVIGGNTFDDKVKVTVVDVVSIAVDESDSDSHKIASVLNAAQVPDDHFVTVEGISGDITLKATITPNTEETRDTITWTEMTQDGSDKLKATKPRTTSDKYPATVNVSGADARDLTNWVVWSTGSSSSNAIDEDVQLDRTEISGGYNVTHTITPVDIITQNDRPNLSGSGTNPPNVPSGDTGVYNKGVSLAAGADKKWDSSRQVRTKMINPDGINFSILHDITLYSTYLNYPSDDVCGNDDASTGDPEYNDPYNAPYQGAVYGYDKPKKHPYHSEGNLNNTFEHRAHFRGFARLELASKWYRISDWYLWRTHWKYKKQNESEATWGLDFNGDGDTLDTVPIWRDNDSSIALDNSGF